MEQREQSLRLTIKEFEELVYSIMWNSTKSRWSQPFRYSDLKIIGKDNDHHKTVQELLFLNILLPSVVSNRPKEIHKTESPDFKVRLSDGRTKYVEVVTAVAETIDEQGTHENYQKTLNKSRDKQCCYTPYTTDQDKYAQIILNQINKKRLLAKNWCDKRPIILLVGLVGTSNPLFEVPRTDIEPFHRIIMGPYPTIIIGKAGRWRIAGHRGHEFRKIRKSAHDQS